MGRQLPSRNPVHHTHSKMASSTLSSRNNGSQPAKAEIAQEHTLPSISRKNKTKGNCDAKNISIHDQIQQYPGEELLAKDGKLFCLACLKIVSTKKSIVFTHLASKKHGNGKDKLKKSKLKDQTIMEAFRAGDRMLKDSTLPITEQAYLLTVVKEFLRTGIPIGRINMLQSLLEKNGQCLTASAHLGQYISIVFKQEVERIKNELTLPGQTSMTRDVSRIFDGSI